jgi:hypothetical protein
VGSYHVFIAIKFFVWWSAVTEYTFSRAAKPFNCRLKFLKDNDVLNSFCRKQFLAKRFSLTELGKDFYGFCGGFFG